MEAPTSVWPHTETFPRNNEAWIHQLINEHICKFKGKNLIHQYMENNPIKWDFQFWFCWRSKSGYLCKINNYLRKKEKTEFGLGESVVFSLCEYLKDTNCYVYFDNFCTSPTLMAKLSENGIYGLGTGRANSEHMPSLKQDKKRNVASMISKHVNLSAKKTDRQKLSHFVIQLPWSKTARDIDSWVKGLKDKVKVSCSNVIYDL